MNETQGLDSLVSDMIVESGLELLRKRGEQLVTLKAGCIYTGYSK